MYHKVKEVKFFSKTSAVRRVCSRIVAAGREEADFGAKNTCVQCRLERIQIFNLPYRRIVFGKASDRSHAPVVPNAGQSATLRYSVARRSRNQFVLVVLLVLVLPISDY